MATNFRAFMARLEALEAGAPQQPDPVLQGWLAAQPDETIERLLVIARLAQAGEEVESADANWYLSTTASAPAGIFQTTGE